MTGNEFVERVWRARHEMRRANVNVDLFHVQVSPEDFQDLKAEKRLGAGLDWIGEWRVFGLSAAVDPHLEPGDVRLRYEVSA